MYLQNAYMQNTPIEKCQRKKRIKKIARKAEFGRQANKFSVERNVDDGYARPCMCVGFMPNFVKQHIDTTAKNHRRQRQRYQQ